jgi:hypothetical protein
VLLDHEGRDRLLIGLFVYGVLAKFMLLTAIFNREFINHDYLGGSSNLSNSNSRWKTARRLRKLMNWTGLGTDETIQSGEEFV